MDMLLGKLHTSSVWQFLVVLLRDPLQCGRRSRKVLGKIFVSLTTQKPMNAAKRGPIQPLSTCGIRVLEINLSREKRMRNCVQPVFTRATLDEKGRQSMVANAVQEISCVWANLGIFPSLPASRKLELQSFYECHVMCQR